MRVSWVRSKLISRSAWLFLGTVISIVCVADSANPIFVAILMFVLLGALFAFVVFLFLKRSKLYATGLFILGLIVGLVPGGAIARGQNEQARQRGDSIYFAAQEYYAKFGGYPASLDDLVPDFLNEVPRPGVGVLTSFEFEYEYSATDGVTLSFPSAPFILDLRTDAGWASID